MLYRSAVSLPAINEPIVQRLDFAGGPLHHDSRCVCGLTAANGRRIEPLLTRRLRVLLSVLELLKPRWRRERDSGRDGSARP